MSDKKVKIILVLLMFFENCTKSEFLSSRDGGHVSAPISPAVVLHILSTLSLERIYEAFPVPLYYS